MLENTGMDTMNEYENEELETMIRELMDYEGLSRYEAEDIIYNSSIDLLLIYVHFQYMN